MLKNRRNWLIRSAIVCLMVSLLLLMPCVACGETTLPFIRIDRDNPDYWKGELSNVRLIAGQLYELQEMDAESGVDPDFMPSEEGMDTLCISGSAQFSVPQFRELASSLRECAGDRTVYVFDLRQESHGLVNEGSQDDAAVYEYVQQNCESNYDVPWSVWLEEQEALPPAA